MQRLKELGFKNVSYVYHPGIYVLVYKGEVIYVGKTMHPFQRIGQHRDFIRFDAVYFIRCHRDELAAKETEYIGKLRPTGNRVPVGITTKEDDKPIYMTGPTRKRWSRDGIDVHAGGVIEIEGMTFHLNKRPIK